LRKFPNNAGNLPDYTPVMRYAEVMLNLAEALATVNGVDARAIALLNAVRQRSDATTVFAPATQAALIAAILNERRIELLGEGSRSRDVLRLGLTFAAKDIAPAVTPTQAQYIWPIPLIERQRNPLMTQNPGY